MQPEVAIVVPNLADLTAVVVVAEVLAQFGIVVARVPLRASTGETPDFGPLAAVIGCRSVQVVIMATSDPRLVRTLAATVTLPVIRVPVAIDGSPGAALAALMDQANDGGGDEDGGAFATVALGEAGARNAALLAVSILALNDDRLRRAWDAFRDEQTRAVLAQPPLAG